MATLSEIAKEAGVTVMTVSNVLNGKYQEIRPSAKKRANHIREIAARLNYRPNAAARAIVTGKFNAIAILQSSDYRRAHLFPITLKTILAELRLRNMHLVMGDLTDEDLMTDAALPKILREWMADGLLINYVAEIPEAFIETVRRHSLPSVWLNVKFENDCVHPDDFGAGKMATEHLIKLGHKRIGYLDYGQGPHYSVGDRRSGYETAMRQAGLKPRLITMDKSLLEGERQGAAERLLREADRPTGFVTYEADRATPLYCAALKMGLSVPADLSIVTVHEFPIESLGVEMTTAMIPAWEMGKTAVEMVLEKIKNPLVALPAAAMPFRMFAGSTCGPPPKK